MALKNFLFLFVILLMSISCNNTNVINYKTSSNKIVTPGLIVLSSPVYEGQDALFTVKLNGQFATPVSVDYSTTDGSALAGSHYAAVSGTLNFLPGETSKVITVTTTANASEICAPERTFSFTLSNSVGSPVITPSGLGTIKDPDVPVLTLIPASVVEGGPASVSATLSAACPSKSVSFSWKTSNGTAIANDFSSENNVASIPPNTLSVPLTVTTNEDLIHELSETLNVSVSGVTNATVAGNTTTLTILDNDPVPEVNFSTDYQEVIEFAGATMATVTLSNPSYTDISVPYSIAGSAAMGAGNDYIIAPSPLIIPAGATSALISISILEDLVSEDWESIELTLGTPVNGVKGSTDYQGLWIVDNEIPYVVKVTSSASDGTYTTGNIDISVEFSTEVNVYGTPVLTLNTTPVRVAEYDSGAGTKIITFRYSIQYDDYAFKLDYASAGALSLDGGVIEDSANYSNADLTLPGPGAVGSLAATRSIRIMAPPQPKVLSISIPDPGIYYEKDTLQFKVNFSEAVIVTDVPRLPLKIGGATAYADYVSGSGSSTLVFQYSVTTYAYGATVELTSPIVLNTSPIKNSGGVDAKLSFVPPAVPNVFVDGRSLYLRFDIPVRSLSEIDSTEQSAILTLSEPAFADVTIPVLTMGSATLNSDYSVTETSVTIPAGATTATIHFNIIEDLSIETNESFTILVDRTAAMRNIYLSAQYGTKIEILDDDSIIDRWKTLTASRLHSCGLTGTGVLKCWGDNTYGQIGDGTTVLKDNATIINSGTKYKQIAAGENHTCGITTAGVLKCWGFNTDGQLGTGDNTNKSSPAIVDSGTSYSSVSTFSNHTCAITVAGVLKCWGKNSSSLGDGTTISKNTPTVIDSGTSYIAVSSGKEHSCAITAANDLKCWGLNSWGEVGTGTTTAVLTPVIVDSGITYKSIALAESTSCGILNSGVLKCWGANNSAQIDASNIFMVKTPVEVDSGVKYLKVSLSGSYTCGVTEANVLNCWGVPNTGLAGGYYGNGIPKAILPSETFNDVSLGQSIFCATSTSNYLKCWGRNLSNTIGNPSTAMERLPVIVNSAALYKSVDTGYEQTCIITATDSLFCWGYNFYYGAGDGTTTMKSTPVWVDPGTSYKAVSVGNTISCGITLDDKLKCWGSAIVNTLGEFAHLPKVLDAGTSYKSISAGSSHACGITLAGDLKCWGQNNYSQLGTGDTTNRTSPTVISSGTSFKQVSSGLVHTCAVTTSDKLKCWGLNTNAQIGDGTTTVRSSPVDIDTSTNYLLVSVGGTNTCAITTANLLKCWGSNSYGQLGNGTTSVTPRSSPAATDSAIQYKDVTIEDKSTVCGITSSNSVRCWGYGAVGNGAASVYIQSTPQNIDSGVYYRGLTAGKEIVCGLTDTNVLKCWGNNVRGGFGNTYGFMYPVIVGPY